MKRPSISAITPAPTPGWAPVSLVLLGVAAYFNSLHAPLVFDDVPAIVTNPSIRHLWPPAAVLWPSVDGGLTVGGRPLVNLSLAFNHALGGERVWGYHLFNLFVHLTAALLLFGIVRRTLLRPPLMPKFGTAAAALGWMVAALWLLHPLQTESVTYIVQRAEAMMGLFYLLTLYAFVRGATMAGAARSWLGVSIVACLLGMATKEVMVSAPLMVLLYDRTFVAGSFRAAWAARARYYLGLGATWLLLGLLVIGNGNRGGTAGFGTEISSWHYALTQCWAIVHYVGLTLWPQPLVFDYGTASVEGLGAVWLPAVALLVALGAVMVALVRRPVWGFVGAWFFLILAPSSSVVPVASQTMAEHRMYLPLAAVVGLAVTGLYAWIGRRAFLPLAVLAVAAAGATFSRNRDYATNLRLWQDTVAKCPTNGRAHNNLGKAIFEAGRPADAIASYETAIRLEPRVPEPYCNLGQALARLNRRAEAIVRYREAIRLQPAYPEAHNNLGNALLESGQLAEAAAEYEQAIKSRPDFAAAHSNLANVRLEQGNLAGAIQEGQAAVRLDPLYADARYNLGNAFAQSRQLPAAREQYEAALRLRPDFAEAANNLGNVLLELEQLPEAIAAYERAVQLNAGYADPRRNLAMVLAQVGRRAEAIAHYRVFLQLRPDDPAAREELRRLEGANGR